MKHLLLFILTLLLCHQLVAQELDYQPGLDSIAVQMKLKSRTKYSIDYENGKTDTTWITKFIYLENGFLTSYFKQYYSYKNEALSTWNHCLINFEYNEKGYLINKINSTILGGPVNISPEVDSSFFRTDLTQEFINGKLSKEISTNYYFSLYKRYNEDSISKKAIFDTISYKNFNTIVFSYNKIGNLISKISNNGNYFYNYNSSNLLTEIIFERKNVIYHKELFIYEYF